VEKLKMQRVCEKHRPIVQKEILQNWLVDSSLGFHQLHFGLGPIDLTGK
jgi:hypothetical protein